MNWMNLGYAAAFVGVGFFFIAMMYYLLKRTWLKIFMFLFLFIGAMMIFHHGDTHRLHHYKNSDGQRVDDYSVTSVIGGTHEVLSRFIPGTRGSVIGDDLRQDLNAWERLALEAFYLLCYLYAIAVAFSLFATKFMNRLNYYWYYGWYPWGRYVGKRYYLFVGAGEPSRLLAKRLRESERRTTCWFVLDAKHYHDRELFEELDEMGAVVLYRNLDDPKALRKYVRKNILRYFFLEDDNDLNVRMAMSVIETMKRKPSQGESHLYIRTETEGTLFDGIKQDEAYKKKLADVELHIFNQSDLTARKFVDTHPMHEDPSITPSATQFKIEGNFNLLLLGFGRTGREVLNKCICDAQFKDNKFRATIIECEYKTKYGYYPVLFNECIEQYNLQFNPDDDVRDVNSEAFYTWFQKQAANYSRIIVTLGADKINIEVAETLSRFLVENGKTFAECRKIIFAHVRQNKKFDYYEDNKKIPFTVFGNIEKIYTPAIVIKEIEDKIAKMVNYVYNLKNYDDVIDKISVEDGVWKDDAKWKATSLFDRNSSRAVALSLRNFIRRNSKGDFDTLTTDQLTVIADTISNSIADEETRDRLAYNEHLRWNAFLFTNGVRFLPLDKIKVAINSKGEKNVVHKPVDGNDTPYKHACLVKFEELDKVSKSVNDLCNKHGIKLDKPKDFAKTDRHIVRHFPFLIREAKKKREAKRK